MSFLLDALPAIGGVVIALLAFFGIERRGRMKERERAKNKDYENAKAIRDDVDRNLDERLRKYDDAGFRDD